jgi:hypothetical protein
MEGRAMKPRTRSTSATQRRAANILRLMTELETREMMTECACDFLSLSPSAIRKYLRDMIAAGAIEICRYVDGPGTSNGKPVYCLSDSALAVQTFIADMTEQAKSRIGAGAPTNLEVALGDPTRHLHLLNDDAPFMPRMHRDKPVVHTDLMAALYPQLQGSAV